MASLGILQDLIHEIGRGKKGARDLSWEEATMAARLIFDGKATPLQVGGFWLAMRMKGETATELAAFTRCARETAVPLSMPRVVRIVEGVVDIPVTAGKLRTAHTIIPAAFIAAAAGAPVFLYEYGDAPGRTGLWPALKALTGLAQPPGLRDLPDLIGRAGLAYAPLAVLHPRLYALLEMRKELGVRGIFHNVARTLSPAGATRHVIGVSHPPYLQTQAEALRLLGSHRALLFRGLEGDPEVPVTGRTTAVDLRDGTIGETLIDPQALGLRGRERHEMSGADPATEADWTRRLLDGREAGARRDLAVLNAAVVLDVAGKAQGLAEAVSLATETLTAGRASDCLKRFVDLAARPRP